MTPTAGNQVCGGRDAGVGVGLDVHAQGAGFDAHRSKLIQHHPRRHQVGVVASERSDDGRVLDHGAFRRQYARNGPFSSFRPHARGGP